MKKQLNTVYILIAIYALHGVGANFAHPITPSYLNSLNFPSAMYGYVFAAMSFTNFAFSPFWGVMSRYVKSKTLLLIGAVGYGVGQAIFGYSSNPYIVIFGRLVSGAFVSAVFVAAGYYVVQKSSKQQKASNITKMVTIFSVSGTLGYFLGGYLGQFSLKLPFVVQVVTLVSAGILFYVLLEDNEVSEKVSIKEIIARSNPMVKSDTPLSKEFKVLFLSVFLIATASTTLTQTFSYYIVDSLDMTSFANGLSKGIVGLLSTILNLTITLKIVNSESVEKHLVGLFSIIGIVILWMVGLRGMALAFMIVGIVAMSLDTMPVSLLQGRTISYSSDDTQGETLGLHNAMKSLGMIIGSLVAGWLYDVSALSPFVLSTLLYLMGALLMYRIYKYVK